jgi:hypothetical protein
MSSTLCITTVLRFSSLFFHLMGTKVKDKFHPKMGAYMLLYNILIPNENGERVWPSATVRKGQGKEI